MEANIILTAINLILFGCMSFMLTRMKHVLVDLIRAKEKAQEAEHKAESLIRTRDDARAEYESRLEALNKAEDIARILAEKDTKGD